MQPALGGNARTLIISTVSPLGSYFEETLSTLKFAARARTIQNKPQVNEVVSDAALLRRYRNEINHLKQELDRLRLLDNASMDTDLLPKVMYPDALY